MTKNIEVLFFDHTLQKYQYNVGAELAGKAKIVSTAQTGQMINS